MKKRVIDLQPGDRIALMQPVLCKVVSTQEGPLWVPRGERSESYHMVPNWQVELDPIGMVRDGSGQVAGMGSLVEVDVLEVE